MQTPHLNFRGKGGGARHSDSSCSLLNLKNEGYPGTKRFQEGIFQWKKPYVFERPGFVLSTAAVRRADGDGDSGDCGRNCC